VARPAIEVKYGSAIEEVVGVQTRTHD
jgi:hypothetical protein